MERIDTGCIYLKNEAIAIIILKMDQDLSDNDAMDEAESLIGLTK